LLEQGIAQLVMGASTPALAVQAIIGKRFYPVVLPEDPQYPCASYQVISDVPEYTLDATPGMISTRIQIDTWSGGTANATFSDAKNAQLAIRTLLEYFRGQLPDGTWVSGILVANARDGYEQDARAYRCTTDFMIYHPAAG
jgi:hypothetical protein